MTTVSIAVDVNRQGEAAEVEWIGVIGFGKAGEELSHCRKGDPVALMGALTKSRYAGRNDIERSRWTLALDAMLSARSMRPGGLAAALREDPLPRFHYRGLKNGNSRQATPRSFNLPARAATALPDDGVDDLWQS